MSKMSDLHIDDMNRRIANGEMNPSELRPLMENDLTAYLHYLEDYKKGPYVLYFIKIEKKIIYYETWHNDFRGIPFKKSTRIMSSDKLNDIALYAKTLNLKYFDVITGLILIQAYYDKEIDYDTLMKTYKLLGK